MLSKGKKIYSIIFNLCPRCHVGKFWPSDNPYKNIFIKNKGRLGRCKNCNLKFEIEPGFWYGAMYVSYAISILIMLFVWIICIKFLPKIEFYKMIILIASSIFILSPVNYFFSRLIWINFFVSFETKKNK